MPILLISMFILVAAIAAATALALWVRDTRAQELERQRKAEQRTRDLQMRARPV